MKRGKRKAVFAALSVLAVMTLAGCAKENNKIGEETPLQKENEKTEDGSSKADAEEIAKAAQIVIEEFQEITDWDAAAEIRLGDEIEVDGKGASVKDHIITISKGGSYTVVGTLDNGRIVVDTKSPVKLLFNNASITSEDGPAVYGKNSEALYIETVKGTKNTLADGEDYQDGKAALFSNDTIAFMGEGTLQITGNCKHAVCSDDMIYMESGTVEIALAKKDGFHANDGICVDGGNITVSSVHDALESEGAFGVNGGSLQIEAEDDGLVTLGNMDIRGGSIQITGCEEGLEAKNALVIRDGTMEITANDDGLNAGNELQICGGRIFTNVSRGDGIDSNGTLTISGGLTVAMGAQMPEGGIDCDQREIVITGGTLLACGGTNSMPSESESSIVSFLLGSAKAGDRIGILDENGNTVFCFEPEKDYSNMLLATEEITKDAAYRICGGGTLEGEADFHGYYLNGVYSGGEETLSVTADRMVVSAGGTGNEGMGGGNPGEPPQGEGMPEGEPPQEGDRPEGEPPQRGEKPEGEPPQRGEKPEGEPLQGGQKPGEEIL